jgi:hypothetical protein
MQLCAIVNYAKDMLMWPPYKDGMSDLDKATAYLDYISKDDKDKDNDKIIVEVLDSEHVKYTYNSRRDILCNLGTVYIIPRNISAIFDNIVNDTFYSDNFIYIGPLWTHLKVMKLCVIVNYTLEGLMFTPYEADMSDLEKATAHLNWLIQDYSILKDKITVDVLNNKHAKYTYTAAPDSSDSFGERFGIPAKVSAIFDNIIHKDTGNFMYIEL